MTTDQIHNLPDWLGTGVLAAAVAALAYVLKGFIEWFQKLVSTARARRASLVQLQTLLRATHACLQIELEHARALCLSIGAGPVQNAIGYEEKLTSAYPGLTDAQRETHSVIRGMTEHMLYPLNMQLLQWLHEDTYFKSRQGNGSLGRLAKKLGTLEIHLLMWKSKYEWWMPKQPSHALVFLDDEKKHGIGFPTGIDALVNEVLG